MGQPRLNRKLLDKIAEKLGKKRKNINVMVSKRASKFSISSEAALIILAKELGIGAAVYQRGLSPAEQAEVRDTLPFLFSGRPKRKESGKAQKTTVLKKRAGPQITGRALIKATIEFLIHDQELKDRCADLFLASSKFDRSINQATLVLEDRIRKKSQPPGRLAGADLVNYAFKGDLSKTILKVSNNPDEQVGFAHILRGIMLTFRNKTHHYVTDKFTRKEALQICGFIDVLLRLVDSSIKIR